MTIQPPDAGLPLGFAQRLPVWRAAGGPLFWSAANVTVALLYFASGAVVSGFFAAYGLFPAPIWLPAAVAVVAAMIGELRLFPGIFLGSFLTNALLFAPPLYVSVVISLTNALGPVTGAALLRCWRPEGGLFTSFIGVVRFLCCTTLLSPMISATGGALALSLGQPRGLGELYSIWTAWWLCDGGGTLFLAPALLLWLGLEDVEIADPARGKAPVIDGSAAVWGAIALFSAALFLAPPINAGPLRQVLPFILVVPLSWVALRMSLRSAYTLISLVGIIAAAGTAAGLGPFQGSEAANPMQMVGTLVLVLAMDVLTTVALVNERQQAEQANRVKSMFLATTSHELRNPLNAIIGFSSMIDSEAVGPIGNAKYVDYGRSIRGAGEHLLGLINGLLDLSKIEAGQFALSEEVVDIPGVIDEASDLVRTQMDLKKLALSVDIGPEIDAIRADRRALRQILVNLLGNAVKFTPENGTIGISVHRTGDGGLVWRIRDSGVGIPPQELERVFAPFERGRHARASTIEGSGLGLAITRGLVALHGGSIRLESEVGRGTTAMLSFPATRAVGVPLARVLPEAAD